MDPAPKDDEPGVRLLFARQQFAYYHEATNFLVHFESNPKVAAWISELDASTLKHYRNVMALRNEQGDRLKAHRNTTFHYPKAKKEIAKALRGAAGDEGTVTVGKKAGSVRFDFADEVSAQWVVENRDLVKALGKARIALGEFTSAAVETYLNALAPGIVRRAS
jgi:hypothetical protein